MIEYEVLTPPHISKVSNVGKGRVTGLDIIRCCAVLFVIAGHFFLNSDFKQIEFHGWQMFILGMGQTLFLINVSLFMMLTGFLNLNKKISKDYYRGGIRVIMSYIVISILTIFFREYYLHEHYSWIRWILKITDFSAIPYGWYIEMWIGLFLLTPFLNVLWHGLENKKHRQILIITLYAMCALPDFCNRYGVHLMPGYWVSIYPICFFYLGAYIKEYQPRIEAWKLWVCILALCMINPMLNSGLAIAGHNRPMMHLIGSGSGIITIPLAAIFFLACYRIDVKVAWTRSLLAKISLLSLDMYLISWVFDRFWYGIFSHTSLWNQNQLLWLFLIAVPCVFVSSFVFAYLKSFVKIPLPFGLGKPKAAQLAQ